MALPGSGQTSEELAAQSRIRAHAMAAGVLAVLPHGAGPAKSWNFSGTTGYDDSAFLSAVVTQLAATECADPARVVISGISDGDDMAALAACALPGRFKAVVTVAASIDPPVGCHRIRIVAVHGDADPVDPYQGDQTGGDYPAIPPAAATIAAWAALGGCRTAATTGVAPQGRGHHEPLQRPARHGQWRWPYVAQRRTGQLLARVTTSEYDATATILGLV